MNDLQFLAMSSHTDAVQPIIKMYIESECTVKDTKDDGKEIELKFKRGYDTIADLTTTTIYDPRRVLNGGT